MRIRFHPYARTHVVLIGFLPAVCWICGLLSACSGVQPDSFGPDSYGSGASSTTAITTETLLQPREVRIALERVDDLIAEADFLRADSALKELARKCVDPETLQEIKKYRERVRKNSFLHHHPLEFRTSSAKEIYFLEERVPLFFEIFNLSDQELVIPGQGSSWLPWAERRRSCILVDYRVTDINARDGSRCSGRWDEMFEFPDSYCILPGSAYTRDAVLDAVVPEQTLYRRIEVEAELIPGGLQSGPFDWGMLRFKFPLLTLHCIPDSREGLANDPLGALAGALEAHDGAGILLASVFMDETKMFQAVESIIGVLPELSGRNRNMVISALKWLTGEDFGYSVVQWMNWWDLQRERHMAPEETSEEKAASRLDIGPWIPHPGGSGVLACLLFSFAPPAVYMGSDIEDKQTEVVDDALFSDFAAGLDDAYYCRRYASIKKLASLGEEVLPLMERLLQHAIPRVRAGAAEAMGRLNSEQAIPSLIEALKQESSTMVKQRIAQALARSGILPDTIERPHDLKQDKLLKDLYNETALKEALEEIMHFGRTPGFYDGQFSSLWRISEDVFDYVMRIAVDDDYAYQDRVLAIMALHERKERDILSGIFPLIMDPETELRMEWDEFITFDITERFILDNRARNLSKYARFSLAKAGMPGYNLAKIKVMKEWLHRNGDRVFRELKPWEKESSVLSFDPYRDFGRNQLLDIGYNYQQYDQFEDAEVWYKLLIEKFGNSDDTRLIAEAHYNLACLYSVTGETALAITHLEQSIEKGFLDLSWMERDKDLDAIRVLPEYKTLRDKIINQSEK